MSDRIAIMNDGAILQLGTPEEIYRSAVDSLRRRVHRRSADQHPAVRPCASRRDAVRRHRAAPQCCRSVARDIAAGAASSRVRPHDIADRPRARPGDARTAVVRFVENLGSEHVLHVDYGEDAPPRRRPAAAAAVGASRSTSPSTGDRLLPHRPCQRARGARLDARWRRRMMPRHRAGLSKRFGAVRALQRRRASRSRRASCSCIVGPTNAGKSTLLKTVAGLPPARCRHHPYLGTPGDYRAAAARREASSLLFQNIALFPTHHRLSATSPSRCRALKVPPSAVDAARARRRPPCCKIEQLLDRQPRTFSGGEQQRVAIGRAIVPRPSTCCCSTSR